MHSCSSPHKDEQIFVKTKSSKFIIFKVKNTFELIVCKCIVKNNSPTSIHFALLITNVKICEKEWCKVNIENIHLNTK